MKILFAYQFCSLGGVETVLRNRLSAFHKRGIFPHVVFLEDLGGSKIFQGVENIHYEKRESKVKRLIDEEGFDFVIPIDTPQIYPVLKKNHFKGILVTEVHTNNLNNLRYLSDIGETETKAIITPSQFEKELVHSEIRGFKKTGIPIHIVPNPINLELFRFREPRNKSALKVIGWIGRLEKQKNWTHFLEIGSAISKKRNDVLCLVIGDHPADRSVRKEFLAMVKRVDLDLIDHLKWIPYLQYDRMPGIYSMIAASGGCYVATSVIEPFGMTAIEALACQCPVVASRVGGFQEIIEDGRTGFLYEANNTQEAVRKIETLIDDASLRARLINNGRAAVERYSSESVVEKYLGILRELGNRKSKKTGSRFEELLRKQYGVGSLDEVTDPVKKMWLDFALSTVERGENVKNIISAHIPIEGKRYLDIGCAYGGFLVAFKRAGAQEVMGIDINPFLLEYCKALLEDHGMDPSFYEKDVLNPMAVSSLGTFDIITCNDLIEHVNNPGQALEHIGSLLNENGLLYLQIPNKFSSSFIREDGHYRIFGITLLPKSMADHYFKTFYPEMENDVRYKSLSYYLNKLKSIGLNATVINPLTDDKSQRFTEISAGLRACVDHAKNLDNNVPEALKESIRKRIFRIHGLFEHNFELYRNLTQTDPKKAETLAKKLVLTFGDDFWTIIVRKQSPMPSYRIPSES